ncbi:hypothetical protein RvY_17461 [Ramazzottius varieornatus]|uniref:Uncharacterized protein n=1 Tax=Ramazzottius varieornatus TaxID=947166 RepID=A0A1D1W319_RAMVA|nr:hypothetical protein RvY_17461 [Ramazzottius varieornatus]
MPFMLNVTSVLTPCATLPLDESASAPCWSIVDTTINMFPIHLCRADVMLGLGDDRSDADFNSVYPFQVRAPSRDCFVLSLEEECALMAVRFEDGVEFYYTLAAEYFALRHVDGLTSADKSALITFQHPVQEYYSNGEPVSDADIFSLSYLMPYSEELLQKFDPNNILALECSSKGDVSGFMAAAPHPLVLCMLWHFVDVFALRYHVPFGSGDGTNNEAQDVDGQNDGEEEQHLAEAADKVLAWTWTVSVKRRCARSWTWIRLWIC